MRRGPLAWAQVQEVPCGVWALLAYVVCKVDNFVAGSINCKMLHELWGVWPGRRVQSGGKECKLLLCHQKGRAHVGNAGEGRLVLHVVGLLDSCEFVVERGFEVG